ncbi:MAG: Eco57I restriction-modification methylase domain-containing protein [Candidatus Thorarchaeota archaeon]
MPSGLSDLAWSILTHFRDQIERLGLDAGARDILEGTRLASLNSVLATLRGMESGEPIIEPFTSLSYVGLRMGASPHEVGRITSLVDQPPQSIVDRIEELGRVEITDLLGLIHALGCYRLPLTSSHRTGQRQLGAYYTPSRVARFIVGHALAPTLREVSKAQSLDDAMEVVASARVLDPACGTGVFLLAAATLMRESLGEKWNECDLQDEPVECLSSSLYGVDLDAGAIEVARASLRLLLRLPSDPELTNFRTGNSLISPDRAAEFLEIPSEQIPFDWSSEFHDVLSNPQGGFDVVVMNPPYERLKPNFAEFLREQLLKGKREVHVAEFEIYKQRMRESLSYFRQSGEYRFSTSYTVNTYQLFIERALNLTRDGGHLGFVVPSTLLGDVSSERLRRVLFTENKVHSVFEFPEASRLFEGVTQSVSIVSMQKGGMTERFTAYFGMSDISQATVSRGTRVSVSDLLRFMGHGHIVPRIRSTGWKILARIHRNPRLADIPDVEIWRGELDLTIQKDCIVRTQAGTPLLRGANIGRFSVTPGSKSEHVDLRRLRRGLGKSRRADHYKRPRVATQQVSNQGQRWRLKCALIEPPAVLANSCNYIVFRTDPARERSLLLLGILNSELMNWRFHLGNFNNHISIRELSSLPIVVPRSEREDRTVGELVEEVNLIMSDGAHETTRLDALVFSLYGLDVKSAKSVLRMRDTPRDETSSILDVLGDLH